MKPATSVKQVLIATKWILTHVGWCQGWAFKDKKGAPMGYAPNLPQIGSCCLVGALSLVETSPFLVDEAQDILCDLGGQSASKFNDTHSKQEVISLLDKAIERST